MQGWSGWLRDRSGGRERQEVQAKVDEGVEALHGRDDHDVREDQGNGRDGYLTISLYTKNEGDLEVDSRGWVVDSHE